MNRTASVTVSALGVIAGFAGLEHGVGEVLQGNEAPSGLVIESWPDSEAFAILAGEPAMTVIPSLLFSGIVTILVSLFFMWWATTSIQAKHGGLVLIGISAVWLLVGGGFGPPLLGSILGLGALGINGPLHWWQAHVPRDITRTLSAAWPWSLAACLVAWLSVFPGMVLLDQFVGVSDPYLAMTVVPLSAFGLTILSIVTGYARDVLARAVRVSY